MGSSHPEHDRDSGKATVAGWAVLSWTLVVISVAVLALGLLTGEPPYFPGIAMGIFVLAIVVRMRNDRLQRKQRAEA